MSELDLAIDFLQMHAAQRDWCCADCRIAAERRVMAVRQARADIVALKDENERLRARMAPQLAACRDEALMSAAALAEGGANTSASQVDAYGRGWGDGARSVHRAILALRSSP